MSNFNEFRTTRLGDIGEKIIDEMLNSRGFFKMSPPEGLPHLLDRIYINQKTFKMLPVDVKTKNKYKFYNRTGMDRRDFEKYLEFIKINNTETFYIFFVDYEKGEIYGNTVAKLNECVTINGEQYPMYQKTEKGDIIIWNLDQMKKIRNLTSEEIKSMKELV